MLALAGCGDSPPSKTLGPTPPNHPTQTINSTPGQGDIFGPLPKREKLWTINWQKSEIQANDKGFSSGKMQSVSGKIYKAESESATFRGDSATANQANNVLTLVGNVHVEAADQGSTITCDQMVYDARTKLLRANGNVRFTGHVGSIGTFSQLIATSDLKKIGTPDQFDKP